MRSVMGVVGVALLVGAGTREWVSSSSRLRLFSDALGSDDPRRRLAALAVLDVWGIKGCAGRLAELAAMEVDPWVADALAGVVVRHRAQLPQTVAAVDLLLWATRRLDERPGPLPPDPEVEAIAAELEGRLARGRRRADAAGPALATGHMTTLLIGLVALVAGTVALVGPASAMTISPSVVAFGPQAVDTKSGASIVTVYEDYNPAHTDPSMSATATGDFEVGTVGCARTSCSVSVRFRPAAVGAATGTLTIVDNFAVAHEVPLSGTGEATVVASSTSGEPGLVAAAGIAALLAVGTRRRRRRLRRSPASIGAGAGSYTLGAR